MASASALEGRAILVVEDEPLIALDLSDQLQSLHAKVLVAHSVEDAVELLSRRRFAAAIVDYRVGRDCATAVRDLLEKLKVPYVVYSGHEDVHRAWPEALVVRKPAAMQLLVETIADLLPRGH